MTQTRTPVTGRPRLHRPPKHAPRLTSRLHSEVVAAGLWTAPLMWNLPGLTRSVSYIQQQGIGITFKTFAARVMRSLHKEDYAVSAVAVYHSNGYWQVDLTVRTRPPGQELLRYAEKALGEDL